MSNLEGSVRYYKKTLINVAPRNFASDHIRTVAVCWRN